jgi:hypothetical protein
MKNNKSLKSIFLSQLFDFINYVDEFYNLETGIYPIATREQIIEAIGEYMLNQRTLKCEFDSIDREKVRQILQPNYIIF